MLYLSKKNLLLGLIIILSVFKLAAQNLNVVSLSTLSLEDTPNSIVIRDSIAYITANESFHIADVSDILNPMLLSTYNPDGVSDFNSIAVMNNNAFVSNGMCVNIMIFSISDLSTPTHLSTLNFDTELMHVEIDGTIAYTANNNFSSIDVSDPLNPFILDSINNEAKSMKIDNDFAYIACWDNGFRIVDISDPTNIVEISNCPILNATGVEISGALAFVPKYDDDCIKVIDISDPSSPEIISSIPTLSLSQDIFIQGNFLYVAVGWDGLQVFDISDIQSPQEVAYFSSGNLIKGVFVIEDIIFLTSSHNYQPNLLILRHTDELVADFTATPINGSIPLEVNFTDQSNGDVISWEWDFENDGTVDSYDQNPTHIYDETGIYTVSLTVSDGTDTDIEIKNDYINVINVDSDDETISFEATNLFNYPNPFNPSTTIEFSIQTDSKVDLTIYNIKGQKIRTLTSNEFTQGSHSIIWNGKDEVGKSMSSGIYYYELNVNGEIEAMKKCLLLK